MDSHPLVSLAKLAVESFIKTGKVISPPEDLPAAWEGKSRLWREKFSKKQSGTFVTIEKNGALRGCIGTCVPTKENIAKEIIRNAIAAASEDYRFGPVKEEELSFLKYIVYILSETEPVKNISELDPKKYGIIIKTPSHKTGLLLPDLEGIDTVEKQIAIACQKGGIDPTKEKIIIYRFTTEKYQ